MAIDQRVAEPEARHGGPSSSRSTTRWTTVLFAVTAFSGAGLLFVVQPLVARLILPSYGGSATVWSTSSLFFQVLLLAAYGYAHGTTSRLGSRWQPRAHLVVLALPLVALPVALPADVAPTADVSPALWLLRTLLLVIGLPFAVVATTGPLLQRWYSWGDHRRSDDPYFLFAASNLGSFGGLLAYPLVIEPQLTLAEQRLWWSAGFVVFALLTGACALTVRSAPRDEAHASGPIATIGPGKRPGPGRLRRGSVATWLALAFLPSSLMLGVTAYISTDVAAIPLLWVVPLAIYLATFVIAFAGTSRVPPRWATRAAVASALAVVLTATGPLQVPAVLEIGLGLTMLALVAYAAHARLAAERPSTEHLTRFFLVVATGGALGGLLNGLVAPLVFDRVLEYSLALALVPLLVIGAASDPTSWWVRRARANRVRQVLVVLLVVLLVLLTAAVLNRLSPRSFLAVASAVLLCAAMGWGLSRFPGALTTALLCFVVAGQLTNGTDVLERSRTFFGSYTVLDRDGAHVLVHGTTTHGTQFLDAERRDVPTTYYSRSGPLGDVFESARPRDVAVVGLGTGTVAAYGEAGQDMTFFEIDPEVVRIAEDPRLFSFLSDSAASVDVVVGDGRLAVAEQPPGSFDLIVLDAFSSDSIPVHLLTEEGIRTYVDHLAPGGRLLVHISNRVFDLEPVLASAAERLGLDGVVGTGRADDRGAAASTWVALAPGSDGIEDLAARPGWRDLGDRRVRWTDDYSSILSVLE